MSAALVLQLELDGFELVDKKEIVKDGSGHDQNGALVGNVDIVADDTFGACASFDGTNGNHIAVPSSAPLKITGEVTVEAWVYLQGDRNSWVRVVGKGADNSSRSYGLWYHATNTTTTWLFQRASGSVFDNCEGTITHSKPPFNTWYHMAGVIRGQKAFLYIHDLQGKLIKQVESGTTLTGAQLDNDAPVTVGCAPDMLLPHTGRIAHVRIHNGPRSLAEIESDIARARLALAPFRQSHPVAFRLYDNDDQPVLYISDDPEGHNLNLELRNTSTQVIHWHNGHGGKASDNNHHVAVRFRPGTLSDSALNVLADPVKRATILSAADQEEWDVYFPPQRPSPNEPASLYLLYKGPEQKFELRPDESRRLTFRRMSAAPGSGARGTLVEFLPAQLTYAADDKTPIIGSRTQYVHVTNQRGLKNIPLHVWLTQGNTVLNDGVSETALTLRLSNGSDSRALILQKEASRFVIAFDVSGDGWGLTDNLLAEDVQVTYETAELKPPVSRGQEPSTTSKEWELKFDKEMVLATRGQPGGALEIRIEKIRTTSSGHANLYVRYEGIPGYQDGQFVLTLEKSRLVYGKDAIAINRNIANPKYSYPAAPLSVFLPIKKHNGGKQPNGTEDILHLGREGVAGEARGNKVSLAIGRYEHDGLNSRTQLDIKLTHDQSDSYKDVLSLRSNGNVGIGTPAPKEPLHVNGNLRIDGGRTVINGFDGSRRHWIKTNGPVEAPAVFMAFIGAPDGAAEAVQISPGGAGGLFVRKDGCVGIGDAAILQQGAGARNPAVKLEVVGTHKMKDRLGDGNNIGEFFTNDRIQGIGISSNRIAAIGNGLPGWPHQHLYLMPKGNGAVVVEGMLQIGPDGGPKRDLLLSGVLRGSKNQFVVISCPTITDEDNTKPMEALKGCTNAMVFWLRGGHLNWGMMDDKGQFHSSWGS